MSSIKDNYWAHNGDNIFESLDLILLFKFQGQYFWRGDESLQETGVLPAHKNVEESEKIVGKGYADVFCYVRPYVGKT